MDTNQFSITIINDEIINGHQPDVDNNDVVIYEVVRVEERKVLFLQDHLARFYDSFRLTGLHVGFSNDLILNHLSKLIKTTSVENGNMKFQMVYHPVTSKVDFWAYFIPHVYPSANQYRLGVPAAITKALRINPQAKVQHSAFRDAINKQMAEEGIYEVLLLHPDGYITAGSRSNLFMIKNDEVFTAPLVDVLPGITRKYVFEICNKMSFHLIEKRITEPELFQMDALFLSGTSPKVLPISNIGKYRFDVNNRILRNIMDGLNDLIESYLKAAAKLS